MRTLSQRLTFDQWKKLVDDFCWHQYGIGCDDFDDVNYFEMYESGRKPDFAARKAYRNAGGKC